MKSSDNAEITRAYLEEVMDCLKDLESDIIQMEAAGTSAGKELVNKIFRAVHSIKGSSGFIGLHRIRDLSHAMENVLGAIRKKEVMPTRSAVNALLKATDLLTRMVNAHEESAGVDITAHVDELKEVLAHRTESPSKHLRDAAGPGSQSHKPEKGFPADIHGRGTLFRVPDDIFSQIAEKGLFVYIVEIDRSLGPQEPSESLDQIKRNLLQVGLERIESVPLPPVRELCSAVAEAPDSHIFIIAASPLEPELLNLLLRNPGYSLHMIYDPEKAPSPEKEKHESSLPRDDHRHTEVFQICAPDEHQKVVPSPFHDAMERPAPAAGAHAPSGAPEAADGTRPPAESRRTDSVDETIRVNVRALDSFMTLAGELVLTRNQILDSIRTWNRKGIEAGFQRLNLVTAGVQEAVMSTRMQPIENIFSKFHRLVRDLSIDLGKSIELIVEGKDVELDRTIIEAIAVPLKHMLRNCVDHGIEHPDERERAGKAPTGTIRLRAFHEAGHVKVVVSDDGAGINREKVIEKALNNGFSTKAGLEAMSEKEINRLVLLPGLSTAQKITDLSGRGVGLDVVNSNLSRIGGTINITSEVGKGTTFELRLPLTLAIIPCLMISAGADHFAIPQANIVELVRVKGKDVAGQIQEIGPAVLFRLRGELLPLISLREVLGIESRGDAPGSPWHQNMIKAGRPVNIVIVRIGKFRYSMVVDSFVESEEVVVKPLGRHLQDCGLYAGATIEGNGRISLILDIEGISTIMGLEEIQGEVREKKSVEAAVRDRQRFIVVRHNEQAHCAFPLFLVSRIERIRSSRIEITAGRPSIPYRDRNLTLVGIEEIAPLGTPDYRERIYIIVVNRDGREIGFMASQILDIVETERPVDYVTFRRPGISGSVSIMDRTTLILDPFSVNVMESHGREGEKADHLPGTPVPSILIAEDSAFFLEQINDMVRDAGYATCLARDGREALALMERCAVDLLLTDIEMPNMGGLELADEVRSRAQYRELPIVAMTSIAGEAAEHEGKARGINEYLIKLNREELTECLNRWLPIRKGGER